MIAVHDIRCLNHRDREAAARCPSCGNFFCRECVTEHLGRVMCAKCLAVVTRQTDGKRSRGSLVRPAAALVSFLFVCLFFFLIGRTLLLLPDSFHRGELWSSEGIPAGDGQ